MGYTIGEDDFCVCFCKIEPLVLLCSSLRYDTPLPSRMIKKGTNVWLSLSPRQCHNHNTTSMQLKKVMGETQMQEKSNFGDPQSLNQVISTAEEVQSMVKSRS